MNPNTKRVLFWAPRVLGILYVLFLCLFAMDAFNQGHDFWKAFTDLGMQLIPALIAATLLAISWRRELVGAILFFVLAGFYCAWTKRFDWSLVIAGPMILIGVLFLFSWKSGSRSRTPTLQQT
ncbi:MAG: hypothetical protein K8R92_04750 [Planctomycetes bacterium]|nr:hypothetical protein [Planctomycetota bacterium]